MTQNLNDQQLFEVWAPPESVWSPWAKPVIFTIRGTAPTSPTPEASTPPDVSAWSATFKDTALIVDLSGVRSVEVGLALAERGFRPVPLFNAVDSASAVIKMGPIRAALEAGADRLSRIRMAADAPPAFLLDNGRLSGSPKPGDFDNRWVVFPQDFPSGALLKANGVRRVVVIRSTFLQRDLVWLLTIYKRAGLEILSAQQSEETPSAGAPEVLPYDVAPVGNFHLMRTAFIIFLLASLGLRRSSAGGFGSSVPIPSRTG